MVFSSLIFLCIFLPSTFFLHFLLKTVKARNILLLFASLFFYAWGEPKLVIIMIATTYVNFICGVFLLKYPLNRKFFTSIAIFVDLGVLILFKHADLIIISLNGAFGFDIPLLHITLPIGVSFYTFQIMSYTIDVYREDAPIQKNFPKLLLYISLFPQLIAGPIVRYLDIQKQLDTREISPKKTAEGVNRFVFGLSKKILLANNFGLIADRLFALNPQEMNAYSAWSAAITYSLQIYFDFSGYSDMAIGLGKIFGFDFLENFNYPYTASSIQDFWRRWHISLSTWFKDYVYLPLGGNRKGFFRTGINKVIVFFLTGLWHGAGFTFILWGLWHGLFIMLESYGVLKLERWFKPLQHAYALCVVVVGFVMFRAENVSQGASIVVNMFTGFSFDSSYIAYTNTLFGNLEVFTLVVGLFAMTPLLKWLKIRKNTVFTYIASFVLWVLCFLDLSQSTYNPFIYFRF